MCCNSVQDNKPEIWRNVTFNNWLQSLCQPRIQQLYNRNEEFCQSHWNTTNSMEQSPSLEGDSHSPGQGNLRPLWNSKFITMFTTTLTGFSSQPMNPVHTFTSYFQFGIKLTYIPRSQR